MQVEGIEEVDLDLVFEPVWNKDMMSEAAKIGVKTYNESYN